ncbi:MAG: GlcNAc-PI de-N-acetylase [Chloroflexi bacterium]|nr:GlcNAc-PI de-N-acetylase [Chloroflexota bacterium]
MDKHRLLGIFAHPDDESFGPGGTLAKYARQDAEVHVCIVTDGAAGEVDPTYLDQSGVSNLAELRAAELACACQALHATCHSLGYGDSGMGGTARNGNQHNLHEVDLDEVAHDIAALIQKLCPEVIITHGPNGDYFHPDHIKVHQAVMRALTFEDVRNLESLRVYYSAIPYSQMKWGIRLLRLLRKDPTKFGENGDVDLTRVGTPNDEITVRLDVGPYFEIKRAASACHVSQGGGGGFDARWIPDYVIRRLSRYEYFVQVFPELSESKVSLFGEA